MGGGLKTMLELVQVEIQGRCRYGGKGRQGLKCGE